MSEAQAELDKAVMDGAEKVFAQHLHDPLLTWIQQPTECICAVCVPVRARRKAMRPTKLEVLFKIINEWQIAGRIALLGDKDSARLKSDLARILAAPDEAKP